MKLQIGSLFLMFILLSSNLVMPVAAGGIDCVNAEKTTANFGTVNHFFNASAFFEVCTVTTKGGNLNVRATTKNGSRIIGKLPNGTKVNVLSRGDYISRIAVDLKGKLLRGWVSNDYLGGCY